MVKSYPDFFEKMPFPLPERIYRYCLYIIEYVPDPSNIADPIIKSDKEGPPFERMKKFLERLSNDPQMKEEFNKGFNIVVKSWFKIDPGAQHIRHFSFLEHYILSFTERPGIFDKEFFDLLCNNTHGSDKIIQLYKDRAYDFCVKVGV